jgi:hypothetical protein
MSVEERLRHAYRDDEVTVDSTHSSYEAVISGSRRRHRERMIAGGALGAIAVLATLVAVMSAVRPEAEIQPAPPGKVVTGTTTEIIQGGLKGTWRSLPLTRAQVTQELRDQGFQQYAADYARTRLPNGTFRVHLMIDENDISVSVGHGPWRTSQIVRIVSDQLEVRPDGAPGDITTLWWSWNTGALTLRFESTTQIPPPGGFPAGLDDIAAYDLTFFSRVG